MKARSLRLPDELLRSIAIVEKKEHIEQASAIRKLIRMGFETYVAGQYKQGLLTLSEAAKCLKITLPETVDLLLERGVAGNLDAADVLSSIESMGI